MSKFKAIDLHIHTKRSVSDNCEIDFDIERLKKYVQDCELKAIAITNHNLFDRDQFNNIHTSLNGNDIIVFPGIEVDLCGGHILVITDLINIDTFFEKCSVINKRACDDGTQNFSLTFEEFNTIFSDFYDKCLLIPHYGKRPSIPNAILERFGKHIVAGEVGNTRKMICMKKDNNEKYTPVMFSDLRIGHLNKHDKNPSPKITFLKIDDITIQNIKTALLEKENVSPTPNGDDGIIIGPGMTEASLGLNVILGKRSSGKTHLLDSICEAHNDSVMYIKQFSIIKESSDEIFEETTASQFDKIARDYLGEIDKIVQKICDNPTDEENDCSIDDYLDTLKKYANDFSSHDNIAKTKIYSSSAFPTNENENGKELVKSFEKILENANYSSKIQDNIEIFIDAAKDVVHKYRTEEKNSRNKQKVNEIIKTTKNKLNEVTNAPLINDSGLDLFKIEKVRITNRKFDDTILKLRKEKSIDRLEEKYDRFHICVARGPFTSVSDLHKGASIPQNIALTDSFRYYDKPHIFVKKIRDENIVKSDIIYRTLIKITVTPVKDDGNKISNGERAEFVLLGKLNEAKRYDILLFDEPEPSFDNPFIGQKIINKLRELSNEMTVFVATHNNTIGASMNPECLIYTNDAGGGIYQVYVGTTTSDMLKTIDGEKIDRKKTILELLESKEELYNKRKDLYGITQD